MSKIFARFVFCTLMAAPYAASAADDPAVRFGVRESVESISLSPDGTRIAYVAPGAGQGSTLFTVSLPGGTPVAALSASGTPQRLGPCRWVSNTRLVCTIYAMLSLDVRAALSNRIIAVDADGKNFKLLSERENVYQKRWALYGGSVLDWLSGSDGQILMMREFIPEVREKTRIEKAADGLGVVRLDTRTLATTRIEPPRRSANEFLSDGHGTVRLMGVPDIAGATQMMSGTTTYYFRTRSSRDWTVFGKVNTETGVGLNPYAIDAASDTVYAIDRVAGRLQLFRVALDGSAHKDVVFSNPDYDVDNVVTLGRGQRVIGAAFVSDRREMVYFDPALKTLAASLSKALPGLPLIRFVDESDDGAKLLIFAGSDVDPGRYFLYDTKTRSLNELLLARPQLEGLRLAPVKAISYPAADGTMVPGYLTLPPDSTAKGLPAIVLPHGGPSARDEWGFDWLSQYFAHRGFAVLQPNFRGSSGYGDAWFKTNGFQSWRTAIGDVTDAGRWLVRQGIAAPDKLAIVGWSYGGYAALQSGETAPDLFKAVVAIAPVTDLAALREQYRGYTSFALARNFIGNAVADRGASPSLNAAKLQAPVLMFHGTLDRNVGYEESRIMDGALASAKVSHQLVTYQDLDHYLEDSKVRADMLSRIDGFLRTNLKIAAQ